MRQAVHHSERVIAFIVLSKLCCHLQECQSLQPSDGVQHESMTSEGVTERVLLSEWKGKVSPGFLKEKVQAFSRTNVPPPPPTAIIKIHPSKDTARPIKLPRSHRYRPSSPKEITTRETGWRSGWAAERGVDAWQCNMGRNKLAEWKIRKRNLSHHCRLPLSYCK